MKKHIPKVAPQIEYNIKSYKQNFLQLKALSKVIDENSKLLICERIELICEYSIWGDSNNSDLFDYFFEENIAEHLFKIMQRSVYKEITISVIQSFAILLANLQNKNNITYLLSHSIMTELITYNYDFTDEEIVDYYISLLKSLALRIDEQNIQLFYNQRMAYFPLLWQAIKFYNHKEIMVRTAVRTIILGIMKIKSPDLKQYLCKFPFVIFYVHFACYLKCIWLEFNKELQQGLCDKERFDDLIDMFYFITDLYGFCPEAAEIMDNSFLTYTLIPALFGGILFQKKDTLSITFSLYLANQLITTMKQSHLSNSLTLLLFSPQLQNNLCQLVEENIRQPRSFMYQWSFKNFWDNHFLIIQKYANQIFDEPFQEVEESADCKEELAIIHDVLGLKGAIGVTYCCQQLLSNNGQNLVPNKIRENMFHYLQTKDDNFLFLLLNLWKTILFTSPDDIQRVCLFKDANTQEIVQERNQIVYCLLKIFLIDPPLRLCTLILAAQVILHFLTVDKLVLSDDTLSQLFESYRQCVQKMSQMLQSKQYNDIIIQLYSLEQTKYSQQLHTLKPNLDYLAFNPIIDRYDPDIDLIYRQPVGLKESAIRDLAMFMMIDKIFQLIHKNQVSEDVEGFNETNTWQVGQNYEPPNQRELLSCRIHAKTVRDKLQNCKSEECFWIEDDENFIIVETQIVKKAWALVLYNSRLQDVEAVIDRAEPRILTVSIKYQQIQSIKESYQDVQLYFDDCTYAIKAKKHIDQMRREYSKKAQSKIEKVVQQAQKLCYEYYNSKL